MEEKPGLGGDPGNEDVHSAGGIYAPSPPTLSGPFINRPRSFERLVATSTAHRMFFNQAGVSAGEEDILFTSSSTSSGGGGDVLPEQRKSFS